MLRQRGKHQNQTRFHLGPFLFTVFVLTVNKMYLFCIFEMLYYLYAWPTFCMLESYILGFKNFRMKKKAITFDRELELDVLKMKVVRNGITKLVSNPERDSKSNIFLKFHSLLFVFYFFSIFEFFFYFTYLYLSNKFWKFSCGVSLYGLEILSKNFKKIFFF